MAKSDHDLLVTLEEKMRQMEDREKARTQREYALMLGVGVSLINVFIERFSNESAMRAVEGFVRFWN